MTGKMKVALGGGTALACGSSAGVVTAHEYSGPVYFSIGKKKEQKSAQEIFEIIKSMKSSDNKTLDFPGECKVWINKKPSNDQGADTTENEGLTTEWEKKISNILENLSGFFKKHNLRSFQRKCGKTKNIQLKFNLSKKGWEVESGGDLFE